MTFDRINRRSHLYLGLFLLPWLLMYGVSSFIVIHQPSFRKGKPPAWEPLFEKPYTQKVNDRGDLRAAAEEILRNNDLQGAFWASKPNPDTLEIDRFSFWGSTRLKYSKQNQTLKAERQRVPVAQAIMRMHFRGGFLQPGFWDAFWAVVVDVVCVGIIVWVVSGLVMWWRLRRLRAWGLVAFLGGVASFVLLVATL
jgi:hypothetical protein